MSVLESLAVMLGVIIVVIILNISYKSGYNDGFRKGTLDAFNKFYDVEKEKSKEEDGKSQKTP